MAAAARTDRHFGLSITLHDAIFCEAAIGEQVAVEFNDIFATGALMQAVDVLGDERQARNPRREGR